ncbi:MAG: amidohydrolase family protein [Pigmentiphaga sp.]|uniref:amidohydrolase family protein n=1 Tax=Pigmentiphaga sp. TaxID=1977564 RepID=UPI0029B65259|nr:amidohydrolase family protein [Pigmentiphaga sp.]MDX3905933.1 amidohydrolase family protein [Pigmentiphaga sp.]
MMLCHCCGHHVYGAGVTQAPPGPRFSFPTLDMHCHLLVAEAETLVAGREEKRRESALQPVLMGAASHAHNMALREQLAPCLTDISRRLADMDRLGIDIQVLSPSPTQYYYWADESLADELVDVQNARIAQVCREHPRRFIGLGAVALQHPALAVRQLREAVSEHGLHGVEISSDPGGRGLDDPALEGFWAEARRLECVVFLHPLGTSLGERVNRYYLANVIGQPLETTVALSQLIFGGVLDRHPGLKLCAAHGGGYLPYAIGRSDHAHGVRPEAAGCRFAPSTYLKQIWYDTVVFRPQALHALADIAGVGQIVAGTDYPFDMGDYALHDLLRATGWDASEVAAVLGGNAIRLLGLDPDHPALLAASARLAAKVAP